MSPAALAGRPDAGRHSGLDTDPAAGLDASQAADPAASLGAGSGWIGCKCCGLVSAVAVAINPSAPQHCPRCQHTLHWRKPMSLQRTWACVLAAALLYVPANLLPIMHTTQAFRSSPHTLLGGIAELWHDGAWGLAIIVFIASIAVPLLKIGALAPLWRVLHAPGQQRERADLHQRHHDAGDEHDDRQAPGAVMPQLGNAAQQRVRAAAKGLGGVHDRQHIGRHVQHRGRQHASPGALQAHRLAPVQRVVAAWAVLRRRWVWRHGRDLAAALAADPAGAGGLDTGLAGMGAGLRLAGQRGGAHRTRHHRWCRPADSSAASSSANAASASRPGPAVACASAAMRTSDSSAATVSTSTVFQRDT